jgi:hypothetical protein
MSGCVSCGARTPRRKCLECSRSDRLEERARSREETPECPSCGGPTSGDGVECYRCRGDRVETDGGHVVDEPVYHVVCHNCEYEDVVENDRVLAAAIEVLHRKRTGSHHRVEYQEVSR